MYNLATHFSWGDVAVDSCDEPSTICIHWKQSKYDQFGRGVNVFVGRKGNELCPVAAMLTCLARRRSYPGPLFMETRQQPLTKMKFIARIWSILEGAGYPSHQFAGHNFRIGAAKAVAQAGFKDSTIHALVQWHSSAFCTYIRIPRDQLASITAALAGQSTERELTGSVHM